MMAEAMMHSKDNMFSVSEISVMFSDMLMAWVQGWQYQSAPHFGPD